ncbi:Fic family protein [Gordonia sp. (in: high G+C Gram-positive bacteria)]|uniref:Fic family protein n=1 Tax=Gordonia sp. (in: high G+C Gram-positive bacteria) TaxID=84139 RepID=UPI0035271D8E
MAHFEDHHRGSVVVFCVKQGFFGMEGIMSSLTTADLTAVIYSSGKVFDGLRTGRIDTENFLRSGSLDAVTSRSDLALLEDLRDAAQFVIDNTGRVVDADYVRQVNGRMTRSAAIHPGSLRTDDQQIGVDTRHGRHTPDAVTDEDLQRIVDRADAAGNAADRALDLFVSLARAQPFEDGNKRTAIFAANAVLIPEGRLLTVPFDEDDPGVAATFNDLLARAYLFGESDAVKDLLRRYGITGLRTQ